MERIQMQGEVAHLGTRDDAAGRVASLVQLGFDAQACRGRGVTDQLHDGFEGAEGTATPVLGNVAEQTVLYLVPLARAGWEVRDVNAQAEVIGQPLQFGLPRP